jgi:NADH:ubiquinone oxidoreductase subunit 2 (subunit N)
MLALLLLIPILGSFLILLTPETSLENQSKIKKIALFTSLLNLYLSIYLWVQFDSSITTYQFVYEFFGKLSFCHFNIGVDGISLYFVLLTAFVTPVALLSNYNNIKINLKYFLISFLLLETLQIAVFVVLDLFLFYVFFESVLPILFTVIILYGSGEEKVRSALLLFLYTLLGSLFMLLAILQIFNYVGSTDFQLLELSEINLENQKWLWLAFFMAFAIKTPLWPMTGWLYRAHADSPLAGSIILAATILKLATYGYLRVLINFLPDATNYFSPLVQTIAIITIIYASLATIVQQDVKALIAYSSIAQPSGPLNKFYLLTQTICGKLKGINPFYLSTNYFLGNFNLYGKKRSCSSDIFDISFFPLPIGEGPYGSEKIRSEVPDPDAINFKLLVKILNNYLSNPLITKSYLIKKFLNFNNKKELNMLVGISETTCLLSVIVIIFFNLILSFIFFDLNFISYITTSNVLMGTIAPLKIHENIKNDKHFYE